MLLFLLLLPQTNEDVSFKNFSDLLPSQDEHHKMAPGSNLRNWPMLLPWGSTLLKTSWTTKPRVMPWYSRLEGRASAAPSPGGLVRPAWGLRLYHLAHATGRKVLREAAERKH